MVTVILAVALDVPEPSFAVTVTVWLLSISWSSSPFTSSCPCTPDPEERRISTTQGVGHHVAISIRGLDRTPYVVVGVGVGLASIGVVESSSVFASTSSITTRKVLVPSLNFGAWFAWLTMTAVPHPTWP